MAQSLKTRHKLKLAINTPSLKLILIKTLKQLTLIKMDINTLILIMEFTENQFKIYIKIFKKFRIYI